MMKRLLSIILSLSMFGSFPVTAFAAEPVSNTSDLIEYSTIYDEVIPFKPFNIIQRLVNISMVQLSLLNLRTKAKCPPPL